MHLYGVEFWSRAAIRPLRVSQPLGSWKKEMIRVETFQTAIVRGFSHRLRPSEFYALWEYFDGLHYE